VKPSGIILAGGKASRMGRPKATLQWQGRTLVEIVRDTLSPLCGEILVVAKPEHQDLLSQVEGVRLVWDPPGAHGPLAGIRAGLEAATSFHAFVTACDMPELDPAAVSLVLDQPASFDVVIPVAQGIPQPLHARFSRRCLGPMTTVLAGGANRVSSFFNEVQVMELHESKWGGVPGFAASLASLDTPDSWAAFKERQR
jgi:molybdopterin-guanine dinucleotide biosynthesis protein A